MIETERLILRNYATEDFDSLFKRMSDSETMQYYPAVYSYMKYTNVASYKTAMSIGMKN